MILKVMSIYDSKSLVFNTPYFCLTTPDGIRTFTDVVNDVQTKVNRHPDDYVLYELGEYDDSTGTLRNYSEHKHLGVATQYKYQDQAMPAGLSRGVELIKNGAEVK